MSEFRFDNVLVLAPHTDDGELGAGGFISKLIESGSQVHYLAFSIAEDSVPEGFPKDILATEVVNATSQLGIDSSRVYVKRYPVRKLSAYRQEILEDIISYRKALKPDLVLLPSTTDIHQDHKTVSEEGVRAFKNTTILGYELIWNNLVFHAQAYVELEKRHIQTKMNALIEYKSQGKRDYLSWDFIHSQARTRGVQFGVPLAEAFEVIRMKIK
jgi:LmbE family N-acetylglucosaminyl deacetylase